MRSSTWGWLGKCCAIQSDAIEWVVNCAMRRFTQHTVMYAHYASVATALQLLMAATHEVAGQFVFYTRLAAAISSRFHLGIKRRGAVTATSVRPPPGTVRPGTAAAPDADAAAAPAPAVGAAAVSWCAPDHWVCSSGSSCVDGMDHLLYIGGEGAHVLNGHQCDKWDEHKAPLPPPPPTHTPWCAAASTRCSTLRRR